MRELRIRKGLTALLLVGAALLSVALFAVACGGTTTTTTAAATATTAAPGGSTESTGSVTTQAPGGELPVVTMQTLSGGMGAMILKAIDTSGLDKKNGFQGKFSYIDPDAATNTFLLKQNDVSVDIDTLGVAIARNAGHKVVSFYPVLNNNSAIIVRADSTYTSPKDLIGKKVGHFGTDSGTTSIMTVLLKQLYDIDVQKDFKLVEAGPSALPELLKKGEVEAIFDFTPITERAMVDVPGKVLFRAASSGAYAPPLVTVAAYEDWLKANKATAYKVRAAVQEAYKLFVDGNYALLGEEPYRTLMNQPDPKVVDAVIKDAAEIPLMTNAWTQKELDANNKLLQYMADNKIILDKMPPGPVTVILEDYLGPQ